MAGGSLLALLDDISSLMDDIATMTKVATKKTAGVLSDDLALNAQQISGVNANRELPVVWSVTVGSFFNKLIIIPAALLIDHFFPWLTVLLLMVGGAYLCFEGVEKLVHSYQHKKNRLSGSEIQEQISSTLSKADFSAIEKTKIRGAIRTDFILSAEIIVIALNTVQSQTLMMKTLVLLAVGVLITVGVYGAVATIVKLDDMGYWMVRRNNANSMRHKLGMLLVNSAPYLMKFLSIVGTIAMFLVGGGIIVHNISALRHIEELAASWMAALPALGSILGAITPTLFSLFLGLIVGAIVLFGVNCAGRLLGKDKAHA